MIYFPFWIATSVIISIFSYAFVDVNLRLTDNPIFQAILSQLAISMRSYRMQTAGIFILILLCLFVLWWKTIQSVHPEKYGYRQFLSRTVIVCALLILSYPFLSYDLFNYIATSKVAFAWHENPYVVMPIEIYNDPNLAFTRAANKVALYGPAWLLLTWIPHTLGMGNIWQTIIAFKCITALFYFGMSYLIWHITKKMQNVIFFALNPLILIEVLVSGHNDIVMMVLACVGLLLWQKKEWVNRLVGLCMFTLSIFIKGATIVLLPLLFFRKTTYSRLMCIVSCLLFLVFIVFAPVREELYPWYAVWFLSAAAFLPYSKYARVWQFCIAVSIGLELRHVPYMAMGYYEGPGPVLRIVLTIIPVVLWICYNVYNYYKNYNIYKNA
ncbi:MAG: hypothetical protein UV63_C0001G0043 [Microgenomates group bacterium GW2011_GWC1_43_11]|uniref:DUF2029 domain-containing protein n=2 Tax=Candidatus Gottesmaniibacteriota TaxID=1752720 RepID=A0A0G1IR56_9BACT|nr:MAG: hypothetical protein UV63_C0001G0043 [Microgenomates group bacterium GW2011_GWC1_43_11]KKT39132.1 MAG: hypothetical protein UW22_C0001G0043 [Candidatus Gottesmanbacteria bacterium GW2011_GWB1_44_11c]KKT61605.1 MAG: hypothetical protein UW52_C0001G0043 [Candidatus Gottesmanbacteria bacterium GW2011_GWA1_44_24b]HCM82198.1 hypothetical protein [Patescibacteria group bacterium]